MKLEELHSILFEMLKEIDRIFKKSGVEYSLSSGTMLGAVRHQGFIPWDDDADIVMWQCDYNKARKALKENLSENYELIEPDNFIPNFWDFTIRIIDKRYQWHDVTEEDKFYKNLQNNICIDIFLLSGCPNSSFFRKCLFFKQKVIYALAMGHRYHIKNEKYTRIQKIQTMFSTWIGNKIDMEVILKWHKKLATKKYNNKNQKFCAHLNGIPGEIGNTFFTEDTLSVANMKFESTELPVFTGYDRILTEEYGDYMTPVQDDNLYIKHLNS